MLKLLSISGGLIYWNSITSPISLSSSQETLSVARHAICYLFPKDPNVPVQGIVSFSQDNYGSRTKIAAVVRGLNPNSLHGLHILEFGDFGYQGGIYNPFNRRHGSPQDRERKVGDLGNLKTDERGNGYLAYEDSQVQLHGDNTYDYQIIVKISVLGRSVCVRAKEDDLGRGGQSDSSVDGNSGAILAYGIIGISNAFKNITPYE